MSDTCKHPMINSAEGPMVPSCMCLGDMKMLPPLSIDRIHRDEAFLKKITEGDWVETRTLDKAEGSWTPTGVLYILSGVPLKLPKEKEQP